MTIRFFELSSLQTNQVVPANSSALVVWHSLDIWPWPWSDESQPTIPGTTVRVVADGVYGISAHVSGHGAGDGSMDIALLDLTTGMVLATRNYPQTLGNPFDNYVNYFGVLVEGHEIAVQFTNNCDADVTIFDSLAPSGSGDWFADPTVTGVVLLGTNAGQIVRVTDDGIGGVVFNTGSGTLEDDIIYCILPTLNSPDRAWAADFANLYNGGAATQNPILSMDSGETWTIHNDNSVPPFAEIYQAITKDEDGNLYASVDGNKIQKSTDGLIWSDLIAGRSNQVVNLWVSDGYIWWIQLLDGNLYRANADGSNIQTYALARALTGSHCLIAGQYGVSTLVVYPSNNPTNANLEVIDISNPSAPTLATTTNAFGSPGTELIVAVRPLTASTMVAVTTKTGAGVGSIWQSTDSGATWSKKVTDDASLGKMDGDYLQSMMIAVLDDSANVWAGLLTPDLWHSTDSGANWTKVTVAADLGQATEWTAIASAVAIGSVNPGLARYAADESQVWLKTTF